MRPAIATLLFLAAPLIPAPTPLQPLDVPPHSVIVSSHAASQPTRSVPGTSSWVYPSIPHAAPDPPPGVTCSVPLEQGITVFNMLLEQGTATALHIRLEPLADPAAAEAFLGQPIAHYIPLDSADMDVTGTPTSTFDPTAPG